MFRGHNNYLDVVSVNITAFYCWDFMFFFFMGIKLVPN